MNTPGVRDEHATTQALLDRCMPSLLIRTSTARFLRRRWEESKQAFEAQYGAAKPTQVLTQGLREAITPELERRFGGTGKMLANVVCHVLGGIIHARIKLYDLIESEEDFLVGEINRFADESRRILLSNWMERLTIYATRHECYEEIQLDDALHPAGFDTEPFAGPITDEPECVSDNIQTWRDLFLHTTNSLHLDTSDRLEIWRHFCANVHRLFREDSACRDTHGIFFGELNRQRCTLILRDDHLWIVCRPVSTP